MANNEEQARVCCKLNGKTRCDDFIPINDATDLLNDCNKFGKYSGTHWIETRAEYEKKQSEELGRVCYKVNDVKKHNDWIPISKANVIVIACNECFNKDGGNPYWVESKRDHESEAWEQHTQSQTEAE